MSLDIPQFLPTTYFRECAAEDGTMTKYKIPTHEESYTVGYEQALKDMGETLEARLMLKNNVIISGVTLTDTLKRYVESLKQGRMP